MSREIVLYIAQSLDGYIAKKDGSVDWLDQYQNDSTDYGYRNFYARIDTVLMGRATGEQVLSFGEFPYLDKDCFVFSREGISDDATQGPEAELVTYVSEEPGNFA